MKRDEPKDVFGWAYLNGSPSIWTHTREDFDKKRMTIKLLEEKRW